MNYEQNFLDTNMVIVRIGMIILITLSIGMIFLVIVSQINLIIPSMGTSS